MNYLHDVRCILAVISHSVDTLAGEGSVCRLRSLQPTTPTNTEWRATRRLHSILPRHNISLHILCRYAIQRVPRFIDHRACTPESRNHANKRKKLLASAGGELEGCICSRKFIECLINSLSKAALFGKQVDNWLVLLCRMAKFLETLLLGNKIWSFYKVGVWCRKVLQYIVLANKSPGPLSVAEERK